MNMEDVNTSVNNRFYRINVGNILTRLRRFKKRIFYKITYFTVKSNEIGVFQNIRCQLEKIRWNAISVTY